MQGGRLDKQRGVERGREREGGKEKEQQREREKQAFSPLCDLLDYDY